MGIYLHTIHRNDQDSRLAQKVGYFVCCCRCRPGRMVLLVTIWRGTRGVFTDEHRGSLCRWLDYSRTCKLPEKGDTQTENVLHNCSPSQEGPMRQSKFTEPQIVSLLKEASAGRSVNEIWRHDGISSATYYKWKANYGGLDASDVKRLTELEHENSWLKRMDADLSLENAALKDVIAKKL
ncbi:MAG: hypothetical protein C4294_05460 [Nitrospiraceae bacterium]